MIRVLSVHSRLSVLKLLNYQITPITKSPLIHSHSRNSRPTRVGSSYFVLGLAAGGSCAQKPVVLPLSIQHVQSPPQCTVALHVVPHAPGKPAAVRNCRAETVPASRTVATMVANNVFLPIFLIMVRGSFS
jgi:hypothetical protein